MYPRRDWKADGSPWHISQVTRRSGGERACLPAQLEGQGAVGEIQPGLMLEETHEPSDPAKATTVPVGRLPRSVPHPAGWLQFPLPGPRWGQHVCE